MLTKAKLIVCVSYISTLLVSLICASSYGDELKDVQTMCKKLYSSRDTYEQKKQSYAYIKGDWKTYADSDCAYTIGMAARSIGDFSMAIDAFRIVIKQNPIDFEANYLFASSTDYFCQQSKEKGVNIKDCRKKIIGINFSNNFRQSFQNVKTVEKFLHSSAAPELAYLIDIYVSSSDSIVFYAKAILYGARDATTHANFGHALYENGMFSQSLEVMEEVEKNNLALFLKPKNFDIVVFSLFRLGNWSDLVTFSKKYKDEFSRRPNLTFHQAKASFEVGDVSGAEIMVDAKIDAFGRASNKDIYNVSATYVLKGQLKELRNDFCGASEFYSKAISANDNENQGGAARAALQRLKEKSSCQNSSSH